VAADRGARRERVIDIILYTMHIHTTRGWTIRVPSPWVTGQAAAVSDPEALEASTSAADTGRRSEICIQYSVFKPDTRRIPPYGHEHTGWLTAHSAQRHAAHEEVRQRREALQPAHGASHSKSSRKAAKVGEGTA
jgi:hypothetical protein